MVTNERTRTTLLLQYTHVINKTSKCWGTLQGQTTDNILYINYTYRLISNCRSIHRQ